VTIAVASAAACGVLFLFPTSTNNTGPHRRPGQPLAPVGIVGTAPHLTLQRQPPLVTVNGAAAAFIPKSQVVEVSCLQDVPLYSDPDRESAAKHVDLEVVMPGGATHRGIAILELPPNRSRALDFLNGSGAFFAITSDGNTRYMNKSHVRLIRPFD